MISMTKNLFVLTVNSYSATMSTWKFYLLLQFFVTWLPVSILMENKKDCPSGWIRFEENCYDFVLYPTRTYQLAAAACQFDDAHLVSVNSEKEHEFIALRLTNQYTNRADRWWTSGSGAGSSFLWSGDGTRPAFSLQDKWEEQAQGLLECMHVVYKYSASAGKYLWSRQHLNESSPYICEIPRQNVYRLYHTKRDNTYGTNFTDPKIAPRGPRFTVSPHTLVVAGHLNEAHVECTADSIPSPTYTWYKETGKGVLKVTKSLDVRYSFTNGMFSFQNPIKSQDEGFYYCVAENSYGAIISETIKIHFGYLGEFSNVGLAPVTAKAYEGVTMDCNVPPHNPAVATIWYKEPGVRFIRPDMNPHTFVSSNGRLYFSETQLSDAGLYHCTTTLVTLPGQTLSSGQPPSKTSLAIELVIRGGMASNFGPYIHNDFPAVFPSPPLSGTDLQLECFAYGKSPLFYTWSRDNGPIPSKVYYKDHGKVLLIPNAELEDSGNYTCRVQQASDAFDSKTLTLIVRAVPFFIFHLRNQHADAGSDVTLRCEALGVPLPTYTWYKNGHILNSVPGDTEVIGNTVVIKRANDTLHNGMYQCAASNIYGTRLSSAQLRVLAFAPNFSKWPLESSQMATVGGNVTITCQPEASPTPEMTWSHNGVDLNLISRGNGRVTMLDNGNLFITQVQMSDQGEYKCTATNAEGSASSSGSLKVVSAPTITVSPRDTMVVVNNSAFLSCEASYSIQQSDLIYVWYFNDRLIDTDKDPYFNKETMPGHSGINIINAQFQHEGRYECRAVTVDHSTKASAYLSVHGPPSQPAGLSGRVSNRSIVLTWIDGATHGSDIFSYIIEIKSNLNPKWRQAIPGLVYAESAGLPSRRSVTVHNLSPGLIVCFRVRAVNSYGIGVESLPTLGYKIPDAAPIKAPDGIVSISSSVGMLAFSWNKLNPEDLTGKDIGYHVYWRMKEDSKQTGLWQTATVPGETNKYLEFVGTENYFLEYEVKVTAFNSLGQGPNSSVTIVMSSEDLPMVTPRHVKTYSYNSTAIEVAWDPIPTERKFMKGQLLGYQITWWQDSNPEKTYQSQHHCKDCRKAIVLVQCAKTYYWVYVQAFNSAGYGPMSENTFASTLLWYPKKYPEYVSINSHSNNSVMVSWRGVPTGSAEEIIQGYKIWWWPFTENIKTANVTVVNSRVQTWAILKGVKKNIIYAVRVLAFSRGGDGKKSPTSFFTLEGQVTYNAAVTDIIAAGSCTKASLWTIVFSVLMFKLYSYI